MKGRVLIIPKINEKNAIKYTGTSEIFLKIMEISHLFSKLNTIKRRITAKKTIIWIRRLGMIFLPLL
jgi:hypothetical protein